MDTLQWLLDSYSLAWPIVILLVWAILAVRIVRRQDASMDDFPDRGEINE